MNRIKSGSTAYPTYFNADPNTCQWNGSTCTGSNRDAHGDTYHPNLTLFMAYIPPNCMQQFTQGQVTRMKTVIANSPILQNVIDQNPCVNDFLNTNVSANTTVMGCANLNVQNVKVQNSAKLTLDAPGTITITSNFEVVSGSQLEIK